MSEERLKEIKDSIDFQEKIINVYSCGDSLIVLNEERELLDAVIRLNKRIDKAIEYIEEHIIEDAEYENYMQCEREEKKELLDILEGSDKE